MKKSEIERHFHDNTTSLGGFDGYVYSQAAGAVGALKYGGAGKNVARVGCGAVAVYNTLKKIGKPVPLPEVIRELESLGALRFGGRFGTKPLSLKRFFRRHRVEFEFFLSSTKFKQALPWGKIAVVCSFNDKILDGMHFFCVYYNKSDSTCRAINYVYSGGETVFPIEKIRRERFVAGYVIS